MKIDSSVSSSYYWIYFMATCCVISIHCAFEIPGDSKVVSNYLLYLTKWAVPFFFLLSGSFFCAGYENTSQGFMRMAKRRFWSLVVPYMLWCTIGIFMRAPLISDKLSLSGECFAAVFGLSGAFPIGNGVLWFLRSLIIIQYCTMLLLGCVSKDMKLRVICLFLIGLIAGVCMFYRLDISRFVGLLGNPSAPVYFVFGFLASKWMLSAYDKKVWILVGVFGAFGLWLSIENGKGASTLWRHCSNLSILMMLLASVNLTSLSKETLPCCRDTFFVYCFHRVPVEYGGLLFGKIHMSNNDVLYLIFVLSAIVFSFGTACALRLLSPRIYAVLSGNRR